MDKINFTPNVPVEVALRFPEGKPVEGRFGDQMFYTTVSGQALYLDMPVVQKVNMLEPRPKEPFMICKRWSGKKGDPIQWDVWRPAKDQLRSGAAVPAPAPASAASEETARAISQGHGSANGNGMANGNGAPRVWAGAMLPAPPVKIPMDEAVIDAVRIVQRAMKETGEQWSDGARQDLVSTILITAQREQWLACWNRKEAIRERAA